MSKVNRDTTTYRNLSQGAVVNVKVKSPNLDFNSYISCIQKT